MPVKVQKRGKKFRVIEAATGKIAKNQGGTAADGGGHSSRKNAVEQVQAINISEQQKKGKKIPKK